nr:MAG TPA: ASCH domain protein [Caudoviricetes sp.]
MTIKPILFNTDMVRAILDGRKTCARRAVKQQWEECPHCKYVHNEYIYDKLAKNVYCARCGYPLEPERKSPYQIGDILYVRVTFIQAAAHTFWYKADDNSWMPEGLHWKPSIHMPKEAARIWLKVTDVRVERLQDITENGIKDEGIRLKQKDCVSKFDYISELYFLFSRLWNSTIKKSDLDRYGWDANPWVYAIDFTRCEKPEVV